MQNERINKINEVTVNDTNNAMNGGIAMNTKTNSIEVFAETVKAAVEDALNENVEVKIERITKNNGVELAALIIRDDEESISPTIYLDKLFERYLTGESSVESICDSVLDIYRNCDKPDLDSISLFDYEACKDKLFFKLVSAERNQHLLDTVPSVNVCGDLMMTFHVLISKDSTGVQSVAVKTDLANTWGVSANELQELAVWNAPRLFRGKIRSMTSVLMDFFCDSLDEAECSNEFFDMMVDSNDVMPMYICTNDCGCFGAGAIMYPEFLKEFANRIGSGFYILPSSIHETILVPLSGDMDVEELRNMVQEINVEHVADVDVLTDEVYLYLMGEDKVEMA